MTIIHRDLGFIYLKSRKTASSSIEIHLIVNTELGTDIYSTSREILSLGHPRTQNSRVLVPGFTGGWYSPRLAEQRVRSALRGVHRILPNLNQHDSAQRVRRMIGKKFFDAAIKAVPVRNPWDAVVSYFEWERSGGQGRKEPICLHWPEWLDEKLEPESSDCAVTPAEKFLFYEHLQVDSHPIDPHYIFFEDIPHSLDSLSARLGLKKDKFENFNLHLKKGARDRDYRSYYTDQQAEKVCRAFHRFLGRTGYSFDLPGKLPAYAPDW